MEEKGGIGKLQFIDLLDECTFLSMSTEKYQKNAP